MTLVQGNLIRVIKEKDLNKKSVAERAGITPKVLSDIIAGRTEIQANMIPVLADAVDVPIPELFKDKEKEAMIEKNQEEKRRQNYIDIIKANLNLLSLGSLVHLYGVIRIMVRGE